MTIDQKLDVLIDFMKEQQVFNKEQRVFNKDQQTFNDEQRMFNNKQLNFNERIESKVERMLNTPTMKKELA